jgi:uncharacterized surface protein with fasciclin (FAS1) repeats
LSVETSATLDRWVSNDRTLALESRKEVSVRIATLIISTLTPNETFICSTPQWGFINWSSIMQKMLLALSTLLAFFSALAFNALAYAGHHEKGEMKPKTVVELAVGSDATSTLVTALKAAGLVEVLSGAGPFTVLAPTNEAFAKLPEGALEGLLADPEALAGVLKAHVIAGKAKAEAVVTLDEVETLNGTYSVKVSYGKVTIGGANVIATDLMAGNGVVHLIDTVILPE